MDKEALITRLREEATYALHHETIALLLEAAQALAAPVQEPVAWMFPDDLKRFETNETYAGAYSIKMSSPTQGQTVPLYTTPPAQPAVPDAFGTREGEHPQYIQGWNDCRAEMLRGKP